MMLCRWVRWFSRFEGCFWNFRTTNPMAQCWIPEYWNPLHTTNIMHTTQTLAYNPPHEGLPIPPDDEYSLRTDGRTRPISTLLRHGTKDFHHHWTPHTLARYIPTCQAILLHPPLTHHGDISALSTPQVYYSCWLLYRQNTISCEQDLATNHS